MPLERAEATAASPRAMNADVTLRVYGDTEHHVNDGAARLAGSRSPAGNRRCVHGPIAGQPRIPITAIDPTMPRLLSESAAGGRLFR
ncbi:hypothetical protein F4561_005323 [Lipingzhangella halophila]|uniref:Uncharacterized protein n=1 Tax=Lipingzhangella halophila TaxID=1783352 RepID=A0A7W7RM30_9ACTN|nr:hypothetical protein [Lipingzhangella halophila]